MKPGYDDYRDGATPDLLLEMRAHLTEVKKIIAELESRQAEDEVARVALENLEMPSRLVM